MLGSSSVAAMLTETVDCSIAQDGVAAVAVTGVAVLAEAVVDERTWDYLASKESPEGEYHRWPTAWRVAEEP